MIRSVLMGVVAGQRSLTPLAVVAAAARRGALDHGPARVFARPAVAIAAVMLAAAEMVGDKLASTPDRTILPGLAGRAATGAIAGAALAPRDGRRRAATLAAAASIASAYAGLAIRRRAMRRFGQTATGFAEDLTVLAGGLAVALARRG